MDNPSSAPGNENGAEDIQGAEAGSLDKLSSGDEILFNYIYPLAVEVYLYFFNISLQCNYKLYYIIFGLINIFYFFLFFK